MDQAYKRKLCSFKYMLYLAIPIFVELFLQVVVGYCDQFMMSSDDNAVNGITNANVIINMVIAGFQVLAAASIIMISQYRGSKNEEKLNKVYSVSFYFNVFLGLFFALIIVFFSRYYLNWIKTPETAYQDALIYSIVAGGSVIFQLISTTLSSYLKASHFMRDSMIITIIVNVINIIGNIVLIKVFKNTDYPILGVALSTAISRFLGFVLMFIMFKKRIKVKFHIKSFFKDRVTLKKILKIGGPSGGESISYNSSQIIIQLVVNQIVIYNANNVGIGNIKTYAAIFAMITYMFTSALAQALQVIIGELLGAREIRSVKKTVWRTVLISVIVSTSIAVFFYLTSDFMFGLFNVEDESLLKLGKEIMLIEIVLEFGRAFNMVFVRALQTSGDVLFPTVLSVIFCWSVAVGGSFLLGYPFDWPLYLGLVGVWIAMAVDEIIRAVAFIIRFVQGKWEKLDLTM